MNYYDKFGKKSSLAKLDVTAPGHGIDMATRSAFKKTLKKASVDVISNEVVEVQRYCVGGGKRTMALPAIKPRQNWHVTHTATVQHALTNFGCSNKDNSQYIPGGKMTRDQQIVTNYQTINGPRQQVTWSPGEEDIAISTWKSYRKKLLKGKVTVDSVLSDISDRIQSYRKSLGSPVTNLPKRGNGSIRGLLWQEYCRKSKTPRGASQKDFGRVVKL